MKHKPQPKSDQEAFNNVYMHFIIEKNPASVRMTIHPAYRDTYNTNGCAIGCQLPDELYDYKIEGNSVYGVMKRPDSTIPSIIQAQFREWFQFVKLEVLETLQDAHDGLATLDKYSFHGQFEKRLIDIAKRYKFTIPTAA